MEKIQSDLLRQLINENSNKQISVIIELDLPQPQIMGKGAAQRGITNRSPKGVSFRSVEQVPFSTSKVSEVQKYLEGLLNTTPRWISSAHSFVAKVNSEQLKSIALNPSIKAVWPNRNHASTLAETS